MRITYRVFMSAEDIKSTIAYPLIAETFERCRHKDGRGKRIFKSMFPTESDRARVMRLVKMAKKWYFKTGAPGEIEIEPQTILLWHEIEKYCIEVM